MKNTIEKRSMTAAFKLNPVAAGCAVFLSVMAGSVYAQTAPPEAATAAAPVSPETAAQTPAATPGMQSVTVSGIRRGIEAAISIKKNSSSIVEAISAEDIGKLPDSSVAESISRLPGIAAQRSRASGKSGAISVRGLDPIFNGNLLNGREQASTGNSRAPEFDLFPAELIGSAMIYKTPDASVIGQGLAATIDLHTVQPLDFGKRVLAASARRDRTGVRTPSQGSGHRYTFSYIDQFLNRTVGVAIGLTTYKDIGGGQQKFDSGGTNTTDFTGADGIKQSVIVPSGFKADTERRTDSRDGLSASLQYRPNRDFKSTLDVFYSKGESSLKKTGLEGSISGSWGGYDPSGRLLAASVANGVATSGTFSGFKGDVRNHMETAEDKLTTIGWNNVWKVADWSLTADLAHSKGQKHSSRYETTAGQPGNTAEADVGSISWSGFDGKNLSTMTITPQFNFADRAKTVLTDVDGWGGGPNSPQAGYVALPVIDDKVDSLRLSGRKEVEWGPMSAMQFGLNMTKRDKARTGTEGRLIVKGTNGYATAAVPGTETDSAGTTGIQVVSWNPTGSLGSVYDMARWVDAGVLAKDWSVSEDVSTVYAMADLNGAAGGLDYKGNVGVQVVHTKQSTTGNVVDPGQCTGITEATCHATLVRDGHSYTDVLPSMNLSFDLGHEQVLRVGAAKVLARANLEDMRASNGFGVSNASGGISVMTGTGGNPKLEPFRAKSLDLSYEKYFGNKGYFSGALFYKKLDTYILKTPRAFDFKDLVTANTPLPSSGPYKGSTQGFLNTPVNGEGGNLKGFELAVNVPFSLLTSYLDGFGMSANHSHTSSSVQMPTAGFATTNVATETIELPGLSKKVSNLRLYYEKAGFQVAWAARRRSSFLGSIPDFQDNGQLTYIKGDTLVDIQMSYEVQQGWLKGLTAFIQANNWNNTPYTEFNGKDSANVTYTTRYGRTYQAGLSYKF
ncbi:MAG: TonB-dependent receptor [Gammaproteobacteria bacterium]